MITKRVAVVEKVVQSVVWRTKEANLQAKSELAGWGD